MSHIYKRRLPECFGNYGDSDDCYGCDVKDDCEEATDKISEDVEETD
ncbi:MAG: hypothetical protein QXZ02_08125 [Candidatus Bathyarchaeia archaeon]